VNSCEHGIEATSFIKVGKFLVGLKVLTAVVMKRSIYWDITPCGSLKLSRRFGGDMFLRNLNYLSTDYTALYPRR
jgi:hypothetical protein